MLCEDLFCLHKHATPVAVAVIAGADALSGSHYKVTGRALMLLARVQGVGLDNRLSCLPRLFGGVFAAVSATGLFV